MFLLLGTRSELPKRKQKPGFSHFPITARGKKRLLLVEGISSVLPGFILAPIPHRIKWSVPGTGGVVVSSGTGEARKRTQVPVRSCQRPDRQDEPTPQRSHRLLFQGWLCATPGEAAVARAQPCSAVGSMSRDKYLVFQPQWSQLGLPKRKQKPGFSSLSITV